MASEPKTRNRTSVLSLGTDQTAESARAAVNRSDAEPGEDAVKLAAKLRARASEGDRIFVFAGVADRDGAAESAWEVAQAMARSAPGEVLIVDADLSHPSLQNRCGAPLSPGLAESIFGGIADPAAIHVAHSVSILPAGSAPERASMFSSAEYRSLLDGLKRQYRWIFVAGPPVLDGAAGGLIAGCSDGVVLIVSAGKDRKRELLAAKRELDSLRAPVLGVVLYQS